MMYSNDFVVCIKSKGKVLRESDKSVFLPFNSEYQIYLKNLHYHRRAIAKIEIDGMDITDNRTFVINPRDSITVTRFVLDGDLNKGKRFKFVRASDSNVTDPTNLSNGNIKVTFWLEEEPEYTTWNSSGYSSHEGSITYDWHGIPDMPMAGGPEPIPVVYGNHTIGGHIYSSNIRSAQVNSHLGGQISPQLNVSLPEEVGATVEGSNSNQQFSTTTTRKADELTKTIIYITLKASKKTHTVKDTRIKYCGRCGAKQKFNNKFCPSCGNQHQLIR